MGDPDGPEVRQACGKALAAETKSLNGNYGHAGVTGPWTSAEESGCSDARAGAQSARSAPAENGPSSAFLENAPVQREGGKAWSKWQSPGVPRLAGSAGLGGWSGENRRIAPWTGGCCCAKSGAEKAQEKTS